MNLSRAAQLQKWAPSLSGFPCIPGWTPLQGSNFLPARPSFPASQLDLGGGSLALARKGPASALTPPAICTPVTGPAPRPHPDDAGAAAGADGGVRQSGEAGDAAEVCAPAFPRLSCWFGCPKHFTGFVVRVVISQGVEFVAGEGGWVAEWVCLA